MSSGGKKKAFLLLLVGVVVRFRWFSTHRSGVFALAGGPLFWKKKVSCLAGYFYTPPSSSKYLWYLLHVERSSLLFIWAIHLNPQCFFLLRFYFRLKVWAVQNRSIFWYILLHAGTFRSAIHCWSVTRVRPVKLSNAVKGLYCEFFRVLHTGCRWFLVATVRQCHAGGFNLPLHRGSRW